MMRLNKTTCNDDADDNSNDDGDYYYDEDHTDVDNNVYDDSTS